MNGRIHWRYARAAVHLLIIKQQKVRGKMSDKITTDGNSVSYPNKKPGPDARIANPSPANQIVYRGNQEFTHIHISHTGEKICLECGADWNKGDSQAGDELVHIFADAMTEYFDLIEGAPMNGKPYIDAKKAIQAKAIKRMAAYAERLAARRAVDELKALREATREITTPEAFVTDQGVAQSIRVHTNALIEHRLAELAALTKEIQQ